MKLFFRYMKPYAKSILLVIVLKLAATVSELLLPYILERLIDEIVPRQQMGQVFFWGFLMVLCALAAYRINVHTNARAVENSSQIAYDVRRDLFEKTVNLSGSQFDAFGLPSLTSRMTSDAIMCRIFRALCRPCSSARRLCSSAESWSCWRWMQSSAAF